MKIRSLVAFTVAGSVLALASGCAAALNRAQTLPSLNEPSDAVALQTEKQRVRFVVRLPKKKHGGHQGHYLSPATKSMSVLVTLKGKTKASKTAGLTIGSSGCSGSGVSAQCVFSVALAPGKGYVASIKTYDALGKVLSAATNVAFNVVKGTNTVPLTLDGVPSAIQIFPAGTNAFYAVTLDPDGNFILGPGAPKITASGTGAAIATITQPTATHPNTFHFSAASRTGTETIGLTAAYPAGTTNGCAMTGAVCSFPAVATARYGHEVFIANYYGNAPSTVLGFSTPLAGPNQVPDYTVSVGYPFPIALDASDNLFVSQYTSGGSLFMYAPPYNAVTATSAGLDDAEALAVSPAGTAFVAGGGFVDAYVPPYMAAPTKFATSISALGIGADASNNVYVGAGTTMDVFSPPYTNASVPKYTVTLTSAAQYPILISGSKLYVGEENDVEVFSLPITGNNPTPVATITSGINYAYGLFVDPAGDLFVANYYGGTANEGSVLVYKAPITSGESPQTTITVNYYPQDVVLDDSGNLYVATYEGGAGGVGSLQEFRPPFTNASTPAVTISNGIYYPYGDGLALTKSARFEFSLNQ